MSLLNCRFFCLSDLLSATARNPHQPLGPGGYHEFSTTRSEKFNRAADESHSRGINVYEVSLVGSTRRLKQELIHAR